MKTIFDAVKDKKEKDVWFSEQYVDFYGRWQATSATPEDYDHCVKIAEYPRYDYYACWNKGTTTLRGVVLYRVIK